MNQTVKKETTHAFHIMFRRDTSGSITSKIFFSFCDDLMDTDAAMIA